ncbi:hypothetical protein [Yinghuangia sp. YIM S10712]|uniref:hypothetical protein n=1 Tax=Yinghuangia sp. YIM S10712 TaxID=3436930 RepID=UPI003F53B73F
MSPPRVVVFGSVKGAPGSTASALALTAAWPRREGGVGPLLVEADGSGGSVAAWCDASPWDAASGLVGLAAGSRHGGPAGSGAVEPAAYGSVVGCGLRVVRAPAAGPQAAAALEVLAASRFAVLRASTAEVVVVDAGRLEGSHVDALLAAADVLVLVARGGVDAMGHVAGRFEGLRARVPVMDLLVVGPSPFGPSEVEAAFGVGRAHAWPWDPAGIRELVSRGGRGRRRPLLRAARSLAEDLLWRADTGRLIPARPMTDPAIPPAEMPPAPRAFGAALRDAGDAS